jgi:hypothetical protein
VEDHEVRDMLRRAVDPALEIEFESPRGNAPFQSVIFQFNKDVSEPVPIAAIVKNKSNQGGLQRTNCPKRESDRG